MPDRYHTGVIDLLMLKLWHGVGLLQTRVRHLDDGKLGGTAEFKPSSLVLGMGLFCYTEFWFLWPGRGIAGKNRRDQEFSRCSGF